MAQPLRSPRRGPARRATALLLLTAAATAGVSIAHGQDAPAPAPAAAPSSPAVDDVRQLIEQKQYAEAAKAASKLLGQHGPNGGGFSRFQVTMLKGDALLGSKLLVAARSTFLTAVHETRDPHEQALATWTVELLKRAKGTAYVPHMTGAGNGGGNGGPIDLVDRDSRKLAFGALLDDELSAVGPAVKGAARSTSLPPILPVVQRVQSLAELDEIANGGDAKTAALAGGLVDHARNLMANALKGMWTRISDIHTAATQQVQNSNGAPTFVGGQAVTTTTTGLNGLTADNANELRGMIDTCGKIRDAANAFEPLAAADPASATTADKDWGAILNDATRVAGRADDVLHANYSSTSTTTDTSGADGYGTGTNGGYVNGVSVSGADGSGGFFPGGNGFGTGNGNRRTNGPTTPTSPTNPASGSGNTGAGTGTGTGGTAGGSTSGHDPSNNPPGQRQPVGPVRGGLPVGHT